MIKVSDFGLTEDIYTRNYFREEEHSSVKLPVKWMALESIRKGIFSEKSDVVSQLNKNAKQECKVNGPVIITFFCSGPLE